MVFKFALIISCLHMFSASAFAGSLYTTIFNVFKSKKSDKLLVLSSADGRIYKIAHDKKTQEHLESMIGQIVYLEYKESGKEALISELRPVREGEVDESVLDINHFQYNDLRKFAPTDLQSKQNVVTVFNDMLNDGDKGWSQCFKRAHMWAYDMWSKSGISSQKVFIFYTKRFQILEDFEWWFHVAPLVTAGGVEYVLDGTFMTKPITLEEWKSFFIKSDYITCPVIDKFQDYKENQWNRLCYLIKAPMYYFRPLDLEKRDSEGDFKNFWKLEELQDARRAFSNWPTYYEALDTGNRTITH